MEAKQFSSLYFSTSLGKLNIYQTLKSLYKHSIWTYLWVRSHEFETTQNYFFWMYFSCWFQIRRVRQWILAHYFRKIQSKKIYMYKFPILSHYFFRKGIVNLKLLSGKVWIENAITWYLYKAFWVPISKQRSSKYSEGLFIRTVLVLSEILRTVLTFINILKYSVRRLADNERFFFFLKQIVPDAVA